MPKYKEIKINLEVKPEIIFGEMLKNAIVANANQTIKNEVKKE